MKLNEENKGITLVALVVTIIILLILAGITINSLIGSELFENTKLAKEKYQNAEIKENEILGDYEDEIDKYISTSRDTEGTNNYSEQEKEIGTWIDGKKLYRKTLLLQKSDLITVDTPNLWHATYGIKVEGVDKCFVDNDFSYYILNYNDAYIPINFFDGSTCTFYSFVTLDENKYVVLSSNKDIWGLLAKELVLTIKYTKK